MPLGRAAAVGVEDIAGEVGGRMLGATVRRQVTAVGYWRPSDDEEIA